MSSQPATPPFLTLVNYLEARLDSQGLIHIPKDIVQPIFDASRPLNTDGLESLARRFDSSQKINCYRLEAHSFSELVRVVVRLPTSSKQEKVAGILMNGFQSWAQNRQVSTYVVRLQDKGLSIANVDEQQVEAGKMLAGWMIDSLARSSEANHISYMIALFILTLCHCQVATAGILADRLTVCGDQLGATILAGTDPIQRVLTANIVRDLLYHCPERWVYWPSNTGGGVIDKFPVAQRADYTWLQSLCAFFDAADLGKGFDENDARPRAFPLSEIHIPGIDTGGPNNFIICSFSAEIVSFILPATSEKAMRYFEIPLVGLTKLEVSDEESDDLSPPLQIILRYPNNKGMCIENGLKRALSKFTMTPIGDVFILHDAIKAHLPKTASEPANVLVPPPLRSETEMGDTQPQDEINTPESIAEIQQVQSDLPIQTSPILPFTMIESKQEIVQVKDSQPKHAAVDAINPLDVFPLPVAEDPKPPPIDAGQFSATEYLGGSNANDELAGQRPEDVREQTKQSNEERAILKSSGPTLLRSENKSDEAAEDSYPLSPAGKVEPAKTASSNFHTAMIRTLDEYNLAEPAHHRLDVTPRSLQTPKRNSPDGKGERRPGKRDTSKGDIRDLQSTKRLKHLSGKALSELDDARQNHTENVQDPGSRQEGDIEVSLPAPTSNILATEKSSGTSVRIPKRLPTKQVKRKKAKKLSTNAKTKKLQQSKSTPKARTKVQKQEPGKRLPAQQEDDSNGETFPGTPKQGADVEMKSVTGFKNHQSARPLSRLSREVVQTNLTDNEEAVDDEVDHVQNGTLQQPSTPVQHEAQLQPPQVSGKWHRKDVAIASIPQPQRLASSILRAGPRTPANNEEDLDSAKVKIIHFDVSSIGKSSIRSAASHRSRRLQSGSQAPTDIGKKRSADRGLLSDWMDNMSPSLRLSQRSNQEKQYPALDGDENGILAVDDFANDDFSSPAISKLDLAQRERHVPMEDAVEANAKISPQRPRHLSDKPDAVASTTQPFANLHRPAESSAPGPPSPRAPGNNFVVEIITKASPTPTTSENYNIPKSTDDQPWGEKIGQHEAPASVHAVEPLSLSRNGIQSAKSPVKEQPGSKSKPPKDLDPETSRVNGILNWPLAQQGDAKVLPEAYQSDLVTADEAKSTVNEPRMRQSNVQLLTIQQQLIQVEISPKRPDLVPVTGRTTVSVESTTDTATDGQFIMQQPLAQRLTPAGITGVSGKAAIDSCGPEKPKANVPPVQAPTLQAQKQLEMIRSAAEETRNSAWPSAKVEVTMPQPKQITKRAVEGAQPQASARNPGTQKDISQPLPPSAHVAKARPRQDAFRSMTPASQVNKIVTNEACEAKSMQPTRKIVQIDPPAQPRPSPPFSVSSESNFFTGFRNVDVTPSKPGKTNNDKFVATFEFDEGETTLIGNQDTPIGIHSVTSSPHSSPEDTRARAEVDIVVGNHRAQLDSGSGGGKYQDVLAAFNSMTGQIVHRLEAAEEAFSIQRKILHEGIKFATQELLSGHEKDYKRQKDNIRPRVVNLGELYAGIGDRIENAYGKDDIPVPTHQASAQELLSDLDELEKTLH